MGPTRETIRAPGSFRDPSGFVFWLDGSIYRRVNLIYQEHYDQLMNSGLYSVLVKANLLIPHEEVDVETASLPGTYRCLRPEHVPFVSYPYEWCFSQYKDAALSTLRLQKLAFDHGMILKDCSAYNIQFVRGKPVFIDTLSFEKYVEGKPWVAYRQFCQHFLAPLALMSLRDVRLSQLTRVHLDGVPLDLASALLPFRTRLRFSLLSHIHLHARSQQHFSDKRVQVERHKVSRLGLLGIVDTLEAAIKSLKWEPAGTEWGEYYDCTNYSAEAFEQKKDVVRAFLTEVKPGSVWDLGANTGIFSRIASDEGIPTVSFDIDPAAVEKNYRECRSKNEMNLLPLVMDLTNPSPAIGWRNEERVSLMARGPVDMALALALVHHMAISNNVPLPMIAQFFSSMCQSAIVEFVPKSDSQVQRLLATREDVFPDYHEAGFEKAFGQHFLIERSERLTGSGRILYLMRRRRS